MPKSKNNYKERLTYLISGVPVTYEFRKTDWKIMEIMYSSLKPVTISYLQDRMRGKKLPHSESKIRITLKKFMECALVSNVTQQMKLKYAPSWGKIRHPNIRAKENGDGTSKILSGKTNRTNFFDLTKKGEQVFQKFENSRNTVLTRFG